MLDSGVLMALEKGFISNQNRGVGSDLCLRELFDVHSTVTPGMRLFLSSISPL